MTANDLGAFVPISGDTPDSEVNTARSQPLSARRTPKRPARKSTHRNSSVRRDPVIEVYNTPREERHLSPRRMARFEHSLTHPPEKCSNASAELQRDGPSDPHSPQTAPPSLESPASIANSMRFPTNGFTYS